MISDWSQQISEFDLPRGHVMTIFASDSMTLTVKSYVNGLVSSTIEYFLPEKEKPIISYEVRDVNLILCNAHDFGFRMFDKLKNKSKRNFQSKNAKLYQQSKELLKSILIL